jgi:23S rRNA pseudouridine1911/1915/1917 synthase
VWTCVLQRFWSGAGERLQSFGERTETMVFIRNVPSSEDPTVLILYAMTRGGVASASSHARPGPRGLGVVAWGAKIMSTPLRHRFVADETDQGKRLDQVLAARVPDLSRRKARVLIEIGGVFVDRARVKVAGRLVRAGQRIEAVMGGALARAASDVGAEARARDEAALPAFKVVFEDDDLVVVDKPAGLLTAPTPESDRNNLLSLLSRRGHPEAARPLFIVHRLDLDTSGVLVVAKTPLANSALAERFRVHDVRREYLAVVLGELPEACSRIEAPLRGKRAVTNVSIEERLGSGATLARCRLETGRTHQIRLHLAGVSHPVLGDAAHGQKTPFDPPRMALHAAVLGFAHPRSGAPIEVTSPWPADLTPWLDGLRSAPPSL